MIANARMYSVNAVAAAAWRALLEWVIARAGVSVEVIDYPAPQPLPALWARDDLAGVFICGFPFSRAVPQPSMLAAPIPAMPRCHGEPVYWTDIVVRADSSIHMLEDTFGRRFAYTSPDSQSGYQAPRHLLAAYAAERGKLFSEVVGPLVTPRRVVEAVLDGQCDAGPVDSYALELLRASEPELVAGLRVIASTAPTPIPPLVASPSTSRDTVGRLAAAFVELANAAETAPLRTILCLAGFARPAATAYDMLRLRATEADALGYPSLA
jgi:ABC-type phosphate/phosphonate transport system substrate-binding protein